METILAFSNIPSAVFLLHWHRYEASTQDKLAHDLADLCNFFAMDDKMGDPFKLYLANVPVY